MNNSFDLVVAGAGPAGLTLAWKAAERGLSVLVFDKKGGSGDIAYTTSGSFIDLKRWGLPGDVAHPITRIHFASPSAFIERSGRACVIRRRILLAELERRCLEAGVVLEYSTFAKAVDVLGNEIKRVCLSDGLVVESSIYADCSGLGHVFNRRLPVNSTRVKRAVGFEYIVPLKSEPSTAELYLGGILEGGYGWLFPLDEDRAVVGCGTLRVEVFPRVRELLDKMLGLQRISERVEAKPVESHAGVFSSGWPLKCFTRGNLVLVGDVALQGNPVAGEGVRFVMDAGGMAADAVVNAVESGDLSLLSGYSRAWVDRYYGCFRTGFLLQRVLVWLTGRERLLDYCVDRGRRASDETLMTLMRGEADLGFLLRKFPKLIYR
jgi:digeranylgeranylglycerophospholipid reductase